MNILDTGLYMQNYSRSKDMEITNEVRQIIFWLRTKIIILMAERGVVWKLPKCDWVIYEQPLSATTSLSKDSASSILPESNH